MIIQPRIRGFICVTAHPEGCKSNVEQQVKYVLSREKIKSGSKRALIIGASTGYGLAARISSAFACSASTIGVFLERQGTQNKPGSAGWYNTSAFEELANKEGLYSKNINGDAYSDLIKKKTIELIKKDLGQVDLVVYSLASSRCTHPKTGKVYYSTLKPIGKTLRTRGLNTDTETIVDISLDPASQKEIDSTIVVMGGENWQMWINALLEEGALAKGAKTVAFTYLGEQITHDIYWNGSIGEAKKDLDRYSIKIREKLVAHGNGDARVAVLRAVVTQASSAIPVMPLYLSLLFRLAKEEGTHEGCIEQIYGLYKDSLYNNAPILDTMGRLRADYAEIHPDIQEKIIKLWFAVNNQNLHTITDLVGYKNEFMRLFGFNCKNINYQEIVNPVVNIKHLIQM
ncbi:Enoyl-[acyl-carrier-protein] reductase [NADH] [Candidatus Erwinia haradaeae]|uniref:Enoyl-[acyl-carrier-protein] reductase [NADH] n=1 Tax=Candidatus Erwinia haradaeae TaxID=1922217 RepID=A0A451DKW9_9GAMM|nr:enoyl-ACP reductase FabV [Candidatus Erwinia haradaeae]VFP87301.1 Enoyl-[acyl-carrier-protein] reductase [NADH] [Candidatus Erwinia haradaeae]